VSGGAEPRRPDRLAVLLIGLVLLPPLLLLARQLVAGLPEIAVGSDPALVELATIDAARGRQSLGPYSRFGFHHPGPAMFYFLLPGYLLGGRSHGGLLLGALLLNLFGLAAAAIAATRLGERWLALATLALLPLLVLRLGPAGLSSAWNPNLVVIAFVATVISGAAVALGASAPLPLLVVAGSLAAQSHLALVGPVATVVVFAAVLRLLPRARSGGGEGAEARGARWAAVLAAVLGVAAWAPVALEQVANEPGNLTRIAAYLAEARPAQSLAATFDAYGRAAGSWLAAPFGIGDGSRSAGALGLALAALQPVALALAVRRRRPALEVLAGLGTALAVIALVTIRGMASPLHEYLTRWIGGLGLVHGVVVLGALLPRRLDQDVETQPAGRAALAAVVGVAVLGTGLSLAKVAAYRSWREQAAAPVFARIGRAGAAASARTVGTGPVHVSIGEGASWELAAGVVLRLVKDGRAVSVDPQWAFMFGPGRAGPPEAIRLLVCEAGPACMAGETVWQEDGTRVALLPGPG
jgi:hypothetical protein